MRKQYRLRKWIKVVLTAMIIASGVIAYKTAGTLGKDINKAMECFLLWGWIIIGQGTAIQLLWEE